MTVPDDEGPVEFPDEIEDAREALDVSALTFGIEGIEGERAFARARYAREANESATRQRQ